jgi:drug/metabolite transporter (DMT)-like permease
MNVDSLDSLETRIGEWRAAILRGRAVDESDADELEGHLREQVADLETAGLTGDEAFLIAVRRLGQVDQLTAEFAREHGDRLWKQHSLSRPEDPRQPSLLVMLGFAVAAAVIFQVARVIADSTGGTFTWFLRNTGLFVLPVLAAYFAFSRRMPWRRVVALAAIVAALAVAVNLYPFAEGASTDLLVWIHLPIALWFVVGAAYVDGELLT